MSLRARWLINRVDSDTQIASMRMSAFSMMSEWRGEVGGRGRGRRWGGRRGGVGGGEGGRGSGNREWGKGEGGEGGGEGAISCLPSP
jgi:hypothetical protein